MGNGSRYKQRYTASIHWNRFMTIVYAARLSSSGVVGYSCKHDCGPSGSCQCGVCIKVGNNKNCMLPNCSTCSAEMYDMLVRCFSIFVILLFHLFYAVIIVLTIGAGSYGNTVYSILGCNCCLLNPDLCKKNVQYFNRRNKCLRFLNLWPLFRLPPYVQLVLSSISLVIFYFYVLYKFDAIINLAYNVLDEEFYPSDHLMLSAKIS